MKIAHFANSIYPDEPAHYELPYQDLHCLTAINLPGRVAQSVGHLTHKSGVLGSIPGLATYNAINLFFFILHR